ncbi:MAG TPA: hypothetical protein VF533_04800 [Solirubrobacteraceae bacterium]
MHAAVASPPADAARPAPAAARRRFRLDRVELACLAFLVLTAFTVLVALLSKGRPLSGADGMLAADQLQYLSWIREASHHVLIGNRYDLAPGPRAFLHPGFAISGGLHALGLSVPLSYLIWKPVAIGVLFTGVLAYVRRLSPPGGQRHAALVLALFAVMPAVWIGWWFGLADGPDKYRLDFISGEMWTGQYLWGYLMTAIAVGLLPLVLLAYERGRIGWAAAGALLLCWLQPWQGVTLGLIVVAVEAWRWRRSGTRPPLGRVIAVGAGLAIPVVYYFWLSHYDPAWELAGEANQAGAFPEWRWPWWMVVAVLAPLAVPAALAYRLRADSWQEQAVRVWPLAILTVYLALDLLPVGTFPYHAFQGLTIPLAILAVQGARTVWRRPSVAVVVPLLVFMTLPGLAHKLEVAFNSIRSAGDPFWIFPDEHRALDFIEADRRPGGVVSPTYAGYMVPYTTGRESYIGQFSWTPEWKTRQKLVDGLAHGTITGAAAREVVRDSHARFVFVDCRPGLADLDGSLGPMLERTVRFGCASVYVVRERPDMARAAGAPDE